MTFDALTKMFFLFGWWRVYWNQASKIKFILVHSLFSCMTCNILLLLTGKSTTLCCTTPPVVLTGDSYKRSLSREGKEWDGNKWRPVGDQLPAVTCVTHKINLQCLYAKLVVYTYSFALLVCREKNILPNLTNSQEHNNNS